MDDNVIDIGIAKQHFIKDEIATEEHHLLETEMVTKIKDLIYSYHGRVTVAAVFGVLRFVDYDLTKELMS